jgi:putative redox protein
VTSKPPTTIDLTWLGDLKFSAITSKNSLTIDSAGVDGPSPVETLAVALAGCMAMDLVHILKKGRHQLAGLVSHLVGDRSGEEPHRLVRVTLTFTFDGDVPAAAVDRAIALSREKYCSVWHSLRQDIEFTVTSKKRGRE